MPIASYKPDAPSPININVPRIAPKESKSIVVDTKYTPLASLITFVAGSSWIVDYYSQVINADNDLRGQDPEQSSIYQQYTCIRGMELKVTNPLNQNQNNEDKRTTVQGSATVYPFIIPNEGDMFAADVGDGREGIFRVRTTEKKSFLEQPTYVIEYDLVYFSSQEPARKTDLDAKSVRILFFDKDFMNYGQNPLLIEEDFNAVKTLTKLYSEIINNYFNWFYNNEFKTLIVPGQAVATYDHYLVQAVLAVLSSRDDERLKFIRQINVDGDEYLKQPQFFKALINRDFSLIELGNQTMGLVNTKLFARDPMLEGIAYGGLKYIVYPKNPDLTLNSGFAEYDRPDLNLNTGFDLYSGSYFRGHNVRPSLPKPCTESLIPVGTRKGNIKEIVLRTTIDPTPVPSSINPVLKDETYILSKEFYGRTNDRCELEKLVTDYFDRKPISPIRLQKLVADYKNWGGLERYYYLVIILVLIKSTVRSI